MFTLSMLALQAVTSILCSLLLLRMLQRPLTQTLNRVCPDPDAAAFWWTYTRAMLIGTPLALVLLVDLLSPWVNPVDKFRWAILVSLCGLLGGLYLLGQRIGAFVLLPPSASPTTPATKSEAA